MRVLFAGGGTAGHINPALAIANHLIANAPGTEIKFVGTSEGLEVGLIPHSGYELELIKIHGFERKLSADTIKTMLEIPGSVAASRRIIKEFKPDIVVGTGGYVCGPVLCAASMMKIPTLIHESNAFPGMTTKILSQMVDVVAVGIEAAGKYIPKAKKLVHTGNPIRPSILSVDSFSARRSLGLDGRPFIVIFGGSLGARNFNAAVVDWISKTAKERSCQILMATGKNNQQDAVMARFKANKTKIEDYAEIRISEYIYDMDVAMNAADLVISRAGASTLAELTAIGKPAILVPSPYVTDNHQEHNARAIESGGGAYVITEAELDCDVLDKKVKEIVGNPEKLAEMKKASAKMGVPHSADMICGEIQKLVAANA